jgi:hypothetical protein
LLGATFVAVTITLTSCTPGTPVAYHVSADSIDIAFCDTFSATSVKIDFGKYPPPFQGSLYSIALQSAAGPETSFGDGVPISESMSGWTFTPDSDAIPENWERIDFSFYDANNAYVGGEYLFRDDVKSTDWAWTDGLNIPAPQCHLNVR